MIGGYHDCEWMVDTRELWAQRSKGLWIFLSSGLVAEEILEAPPEVRQTFEETFRQAEELLPIASEIEDLPLEYLKSGVVSAKIPRFIAQGESDRFRYFFVSARCINPTSRRVRTTLSDPWLVMRRWLASAQAWKPRCNSSSE